MKFRLTLIGIFILAILVWYSPILFKGYNPLLVNMHGIVRMRNYALVGIIGSENDLGVVLSTDQLNKINVSMQGSKLTVILGSLIFRIFTPTTNQLVLINCILHGLALIIFGLTVYNTMGYRIFLYFSLIYIFLPSNWSVIYMNLYYPFSIIFLALFFYFFTKGVKQFK